MQKGDIVRWEYQGWIVGAKPEEDELFETTLETLAKEKGIHKEGALYGPAPLIVGAGKLVKGLEASILAAEPGKETEVTVSPAEAYGERDPKKVEVHSMAEIMRLPEFRKGDEEVAPGARVVINNKAGTIISANPGRVRVDFNHQLAGKTLRYRYTVGARAETGADKVAFVLEMYYGKPGDFRVQVKDDEADIVLMEQCKYDPRWMLTKLQIVRDLREYAGIGRVRLTEEYVKPEEKKEARAEGKKDEAGPEKKEETGEGKPQEKEAATPAPGQEGAASHAHGHTHEDGQSHAHEHAHEHAREHAHEEGKGHSHDHGHDHGRGHEHEHDHG